MKSIRLCNYRCFKNTGQIDLKPFNVLVGANSSGKSTLCDFFPLLQQSVGVELDGVLRWNKVDGIDYGSFANTVNDDEAVPSGEREIQVDFSFKRDIYEPYVLGQEYTEKDFKVSMKIRQPQENKAERIFELTLDCGDVVQLSQEDSGLKVVINGDEFNPGPQRLSFRNGDNFLPKIMTEPIGAEQGRDVTKELGAIFTSYGDDEVDRVMKNAPHPFSWMPERILSMDEARQRADQLKLKDERQAVLLQRHSVFSNLNVLIREVNDYISVFSHRIFYVKPLRSYPSRSYRRDNLAMGQVGSDVGDVARFIEKLERDKLIGKFNEWCGGRFGFNLKTRGQGDAISLWIQLKNDHERNIVDVGFGYAQLVPIVAMLWRELIINKENREAVGYRVPLLFIIEQPELHLHPRLTAKFAEALCDVVKGVIEFGLNLKLMVETHSEILIRSISSAIRRKMLNEEMVQVLMFNPEKNEQGRKQVEIATFDDKGRLKKWPYGFLADHAY